MVERYLFGETVMVVSAVENRCKVGFGGYYSDLSVWSMSSQLIGFFETKKSTNQLQDH